MDSARKNDGNGLFTCVFLIPDTREFSVFSGAREETWTAGCHMAGLDCPAQRLRSTGKCGWVRRPALGHMSIPGWRVHGAQSTGTRGRANGPRRATWRPRIRRLTHAQRTLRRGAATVPHAWQRAQAWQVATGARRLAWRAGWRTRATRGALPLAGATYPTAPYGPRGATDVVLPG